VEANLPPDHVAVVDVGTDRAVAGLGVGLVELGSVWKPEGRAGDTVDLVVS
jgi:hypothetical protein